VQDQGKGGEMGGECSMCVKYEKCTQNFGWKSREGEITWGEQRRRLE
jgi:hypothetical protein